MENGYFKLIIKRKRINCVSTMDDGNSNESHSKFFLRYYPKQLPETWNNQKIDDFVQKLGFLESQTADVDRQVKLFQQLNQVTTVSLSTMVW